MRFLDTPHPLIVILGPTAVGKTELSLQLAEHFNGEIVSADSRLFYRGMDIGTAKPTRAEQARVRHHLIDVADPDQVWSLAVFQRAARAAIEDIHTRGKLPFLVGGTGQYVRAVIEGWDVPAQAPDERLRKVLEDWAAEIGAQGLYDRLAAIDPGAAARIDARNVRRTVRALEVIFRTGERFSKQRQKGPSPYDLLQIGLIRPRTELFARVDARIDAMLASGFEAEVRKLLAKGYDPAASSLSAIGYREMIAVVGGKMSQDEAVMLMRRLTRQFIRRQANWFKENDPQIHWFEMGSDTLFQVEELIRKE